MISIAVFISLFFIKVKELGLYGMNCSCLARDAQKMFEVYWMLAEPGMDQLPSKFPENLAADYSMSSPAHLPINGTSADVFFAVSLNTFFIAICLATLIMSHPLSHPHFYTLHCLIPTVS